MGRWLKRHLRGARIRRVEGKEGGGKECGWVAVGYIYVLDRAIYIIVGYCNYIAFCVLVTGYCKNLCDWHQAFQFYRWKAGFLNKSAIDISTCVILCCGRATLYIVGYFALALTSMH